MIRKYQTQQGFVLIVVITLALLIQLAFATVAQASTAEAPQTKTCRIKVLPGWRPYRVQQDDTLANLAQRAGVSSEDFMTVNCLTTTEISTGDLVLLPANLLPATTAAPVQTEVVTTSTTVEPLVTIISATATLTESVATPTPVAGALADVELPAPPTGSFGGTGGVVTLILFLIAATGIFTFVLRPRPEDSPAVQKLFGILGNFVLLFAGLLIGLIFFPMLRPISFTTLPTSVSAGLAMALIALLAVKELFVGNGRWRTLNRLLNFGMAPLLVLFCLTVASRVAEVIR
ncbi:MAG: LysM peptidoglycan-binding domain-containing protein [Caldilineaceae bacterium]